MKLPDKIDLGGRPHKVWYNKQMRRICLRHGVNRRERYIEIYCGCGAQYRAMVALLTKGAMK